MRMTTGTPTARGAETPPTSGRTWPALVTVGAIATLPHLSLVAANVGQGLDLAAVATWWLATLAVALAAVLGVARWRPAAVGPVAVVVAVALYLFFHYPLVTSLGASLGVPLADPAWWAVVTAVLLGVAAVLGRRRAVQQLLAVVAPALLLAPVLQLLFAPPVDAGTAAVEVPSGTVAELTRTPNVYWFVLDGLAGVPYLRDEVGVDTAPLVAALERDGFDVLEGARTNYPFTHLAVSSVLEMTYVYDGVEEPPGAPYFATLQGDNRTVDTFLANGYDYVHAYPGLWGGSRCGGRQDVCLGEHGPLTETEAALVQSTPLVDVVVDAGTHASIATANDPAAVTGRVLSSAAQDPTFTFVHVMNPHPPYLRDADCDLREVELDFAAWGDGPEYRDAVTCLFDQLEVAVASILATDDDPVIVLSGDHGPRLGLSGDTRGEVLLEGEMFFSAFSAIRLPAACDGIDPPQDMTFVNTFRIVFACLTDTQPDLLEDRLFPIRRDYD